MTDWDTMARGIGDWSRIKVATISFIGMARKVKNNMWKCWEWKKMLLKWTIYYKIDEGRSTKKYYGIFKKMLSYEVSTDKSIEKGGAKCNEIRKLHLFHKWMIYATYKINGWPQSPDDLVFAQTKSKPFHKKKNTIKSWHILRNQTPIQLWGLLTHSPTSCTHTFAQWPFSLSLFSPWFMLLFILLLL